jgi:hypothetical protein
MSPPSHPLFHPASLYSRLRQSCKPDDRLRGYFRWLASQTPGVNGTARAWRGRSPSPAAAEAMVFRADRPDRPLPAAVSVALLDDGRARRLDVTFQLTDAGDHPGRPVACRAFLLDADVLARLGAARAADLPSAVAAAFRPEVLRDFGPARVLSALPDIDGCVSAKGRGECRSPAVLEAGAALPERVRLVIAVEATGP